MVLMDIKKLIRKRIEELSLDYQKDSGYEMCKDFIQNNSVGRIDDFINIDIYECIKCLYYIKNTLNKSAIECSIFIDSIKDYVETLDYRDFTDLFDLLFALGNSKQRRFITDYLREESDFNAVRIFRCINFNELKSLATADMSDWEKTRSLKKIIKGLREVQKKCDVASIIELVSKDKDALGDVLSLIEVHKKMTSDREKLEFSLDLFSFGLRKKDKNRIVNSFYKDFYKPKAILGAINSIRLFVSGVEKEEATYYKDAKREAHGYEVAISMLEEALQKREIFDSRAIIKNVKNEEIKKAILLLIYEHNMKYYNSLEEKHNKLCQSSVSAYIEVLNKYNINIPIDVSKRLMINPIEEFSEIVEIISKFGLSLEQIIRVLSKTNVNVSRKIKELVDKGYLVSGFICEHLDLFDEKSNSYNSLTTNMSILDRYNINPLLFANTPEVLLIDSELFENNLSFMDSYGLIKCLKTTSDFMFVGYSNLASKIDCFIELGLFSFLEQDLNLLNCDNIKRLYVLRALNFEIDDLDILREILQSNKFMINDDMLDEYIPDILPYKDKTSFDIDFSDLEKYRNDKNTYLIGGVLISSHKVKRLIEKGFTLYDAIFDGILISDDEYRQMISTLCYKK